jgi:predicted house-cleaning noncanonical NTP pyrophosphatase (MazG superfamily)
MRFYYGPDREGKLVRDRVPELTLAQGHDVRTRVVGETALAGEILRKLPEEIDEVSAELEGEDAGKEKEELADVLTLVYSYMRVRGFKMADIEELMREKTDRKGAFDRGIILEYVGLNPEGEDYEFWLEHFRSQPNRYTEEEIDE